MTRRRWSTRWWRRSRRGFPTQREPEADARLAPAARLAAALLRVSERALVPRGERLVLLIDGLDEYDPPAGAVPADPLVAFLPYALPPGVSVLCASRPRHPYIDKLATRGVLEQIDLDDAPSFADDNAATVRAFWEREAPRLGFDAAVRRRGRGARRWQRAARRDAAPAPGGVPPEQRRVEDIPRGLAASIASAWERVAIEPPVVDGLGLLCAAREALTLDELGPSGRLELRAAAPGVRARSARAAHRDPAHGSGARVPAASRLDPRACRRSIGIDRARGASPSRWRRRWPLAGARGAAARRYALRHALIHRVEAGAWADAWRLAADMSFLEAKCRELGAHEAEIDVARSPTLSRERRRGASRALRRPGPGARAGIALAARRPGGDGGAGVEPAAAARGGARTSSTSSCSFRSGRGSCACATWRPARARAGAGSRRPRRRGERVRGDAGRPARGLGVGGPHAQGLGPGERARGGHPRKATPAG